MVDTKVVVSAVLPRNTCAPLTNLLPVTVRLKSPTESELGATDCTTGIGFCKETGASLVKVASAMLVAVIVTLVELGSVEGALYSPAAVIVPTVAFPAAFPSTNHVTAPPVRPFASVTTAENCWASPILTSAPLGEITTPG